MSLAQPWLSDPEDVPFLDPVLHKRTVKVKHVKWQEELDKKVRPRCLGLFYRGPRMAGCLLDVTGRASGSS